jgi:hypothetical protein
MFEIPKTEKALKSKISYYRSALNKEKRYFGYISDGHGKRYILFWLLFILNNSKKSENYFKWYQSEFPNDSGEPLQTLCWSLGLLRLQKEEESIFRLAEAMLSNLYMIPHIIQEEIHLHDIWHSSNVEEFGYLNYIPKGIIENISQREMVWIKEQYNSLTFRRIKKRYIEIFHELQFLKEVKDRKKLLSESRSLLDWLNPAFG